MNKRASMKARSICKTVRRGSHRFEEKKRRSTTLYQIENRLRDAYDAGKCNGIVAEVRKWRNDERYLSIRLLAACILMQNGEKCPRRSLGFGR